MLLQGQVLLDVVHGFREGQAGTFCSTHACIIVNQRVSGLRDPHEVML